MDDFWTFAYRRARGFPDDVRVSFTVWRLRFLWRSMHDRQKALDCEIGVGCDGRWGFGFTALKQPEAVA